MQDGARRASGWWRVGAKGREWPVASGEGARRRALPTNGGLRPPLPQQGDKRVGIAQDDDAAHTAPPAISCLVSRHTAAHTTPAGGVRGW